MPQSDLPLALLRAYAPELTEPPALDLFWSATMADARSHDLGTSFEPIDNLLAAISTFDVTYAGFGGSPVRAWLHLPAGSQAPLPAVVEYLGYGGGSGLAHERVMWSTAGYAHFVMDTRGYFDVAVLDRRASTPALFSVGLMDEICPPSTVFAAYNAYGGPKEIREYPFNNHEGGQGFHDSQSCAGSANDCAPDGAHRSFLSAACRSSTDSGGPWIHDAAGRRRAIGIAFGLALEESPLPHQLSDLPLALGLDDLGETFVEHESGPPVRRRFDRNSCGDHLAGTCQFLS